MKNGKKKIIIIIVLILLCIIGFLLKDRISSHSNDNKNNNKKPDNVIKQFNKVVSLDNSQIDPQNASIDLVNGVYILSYAHNIVVMDQNYNILLQEEDANYKIYSKSFIIYRKNYAQKYNIEDGKLTSDVKFTEMFNLYKNSYDPANINYIYDDLYYIIESTNYHNGFIYDAKQKKEIQTNLENESDLNYKHSFLFGDFVESKYIAIVKNGKTGVINDKNELVVDFKYDYNKQYHYIPFDLLSEESFVLRKNNQYEFINVKENIIIEDVIYINNENKFKENYLVKIEDNGDKKYSVTSYNVNGSIIDNKTFDNINKTTNYFEDYEVLLNNNNEIVYLTYDGKIQNKTFDNDILCYHQDGDMYGDRCELYKNKTAYKDKKHILYNGEKEIGRFNKIYELDDKILVSNDDSDGLTNYGLINKNFDYLLDIKYKIANYLSTNYKYTFPEEYKNDNFVFYNENTIIEYNKGTLSSPIQFNFDTSKYKIVYIIDKEHIVIESINSEFPGARRIIDTSGNIIIDGFVNYQYLFNNYHYIEYWTKEKYGINSIIIEIYDNDFNKISPNGLAYKIITNNKNLNGKYYLGLDGLYVFNPDSNKNK